MREILGVAIAVLLSVGSAGAQDFEAEDTAVNRGDYVFAFGRTVRSASSHSMVPVLKCQNLTSDRPIFNQINRRPRRSLSRDRQIKST